MMRESRVGLGQASLVGKGMTPPAWQSPWDVYVDRDANKHCHACLGMGILLISGLPHHANTIVLTYAIEDGCQPNKQHTLPRPLVT